MRGEDGGEKRREEGREGGEGRREEEGKKWLTEWYSSESVRLYVQLWLTRDGHSWF